MENDDTVRHGTALGYKVDKCRCEECRDAHRRYQAVYRESRKSGQPLDLDRSIRGAKKRSGRPSKVAEHGTRTMYVRDGCRCAECTQAEAEHLTDYDSRTAWVAASTHGIAAYNAGCRCPECRSAKAGGRRSARYGLSPEQYDELLRAQENCCAICGDSSVDSLVIDHDHETGQVRGLLCRRCNVGLGFFGDDINGLMEAIEYLSAPPSRRMLNYLYDC